MLVTFHVVKQEDEFFRGRQLDHRALQMNALHVAAKARDFLRDAGTQGQARQRGQLADFGSARGASP